MKKLILMIAACAFVVGCKAPEDDSTASDIEETAQQIGDIMASMDEQGGDDGTIASVDPRFYKKTFERFNEEPPAAVATNVLSLLVAPAEAVNCSTGGVGTGWATCSGRTLVRSFNGCTVGTAILSGDVTLTWAGNGTACSWGGSPASGNTITRVPNFSITGRRGATLSVSATTLAGTPSTGQTLKYVSGTAPNMVFHFTNDGVRRKFTTASNATLFDQTTTVASGTPIVVTGNSRTNRVMNGGFLTVTDTLNTITCNFSPSSVTWSSATCNCPVQGSWGGSCTNGSSTTLTITGCGTGTYTEGSETTTVTFDRCSSN